MRSERGIALVTVIMGIAAIVLLTLVVQQVATYQLGQASFQRKEDTILATTEAMLERYAAKLTIDPAYYQHYVDEAEAPRICTDPDSSGYQTTVQPGNPWIEDCTTWDYDDVVPAAWYSHPLLGDASVLVHVAPPIEGRPLEVTVAGRQGDHVSLRVVRAEIRAQAISEFVRMVEGELRYGSGAKTFGPVYAGYRVGYLPGGEAYGNVYAEYRIGGWWQFGPPIWKNGAQGWDSTGNFNDAGETIRDVYPDPIDFDRFWDDLALLQAAACQGGGVCLDPAHDSRIPSGVDAYLIETVEVGGETKLRVSYATTPPPGSWCLTSEERWWVRSQVANWQYLDTFDLPKNGAVWGNQHIVLGRDADHPFVLDGAITVYAGTSSSRKNVVIGADLRYADGLDGSDVLGVVASDEIWINPYSVGTDRELNIYGALLNQNGAMRVAYDCGTSGSSLVPPASELNTYGSNASIGTGNMGCCFTPRNYNFDERLATLRPPFFPLLSTDWSYTNWREIAAPCWARPGGC
ncbi:MAG TPA: hypothetical protein ENK55_00925 [Actinobacteria bacterium]|nr:hypothetical protein [Actinomycetota bacterium]